MSKTDHHTREPHALRYDRTYNRRPVTPRAQAIAEQLMAHMDLDEPARETVDCEAVDFFLDPEVDAYIDVDEALASDDRLYYDDDNDLPEWERALLEEYDYLEEYDEFDYEVEYVDEPQCFDDDEPDYDWLPCVSMDEAREMFGGAFTIEGPSVRTTPQTRSYRVWELAQEIGVTSKDLVRWMRLNGEYVKTHQSCISEAVWIDLVGMQAHLQDTLGKRPEPPADPITLLRQRLLGSYLMGTIRRPGRPRTASTY